MEDKIKESGWKISSSLATVITAIVVLAGALIAVAGWIDSYFAKHDELKLLKCETKRELTILDLRSKAAYSYGLYLNARGNVLYFQFPEEARTDWPPLKEIIAEIVNSKTGAVDAAALARFAGQGQEHLRQAGVIDKRVKELVSRYDQQPCNPDIQED